MRNIAYLTKAEDDLAHIYHHYAVHRGVKDVADKILFAIKKSILETLSYEPAIGRPVESTKVKDLRGFLAARSHWVLYSHDDDTIYVRRIIAAKEMISWSQIEF